MTKMWAGFRETRRDKADVPGLAIMQSCFHSQPEGWGWRGYLDPEPQLYAWGC